MTLILTTRPPEKSVPRNEPAPVINPRIQETLARIGGIVPEGGGVYAGQPVYRLAWGQTEKHWSRGKMRLRFPDEDIEPVLVQERFFVSPEVFARAAAWQTEREKNRVARFLNFDYTIFAENTPLSGYLREFESSLDYVTLDEARGSRETIENDLLGIAGINAPDDWIYLCDVCEVIEIGKACWFVMRWIPSSSHGGRKQWNELRYTTEAYVPELNCVVPIIDDLGEFPENGFWIPRLQIAEFLRDDTGNYRATDFKYTEPTTANCVEPIVEMLYERAKLTNQDKDPIRRAARHEELLFERRDAAVAAKQAEANASMGVDQITAG